MFPSTSSGNIFFVSCQGISSQVGIFPGRLYAAVEPRSCHEVAMSVSEGWKGGDELACWPILDKKQVAEHQKVPSIYRKKKIS